MTAGWRCGEYTLLTAQRRDELFEYWLAAHHQSGREIVLALLHPWLSQDLELTELLRQIFERQMRWRHPMIASLLEWFECSHPNEAQTYAAILELVPGIDCARVLHTMQAMHPMIAARIVERLARAIHESGAEARSVADSIRSLRTIVIDPDGEPHLLPTPAPGLGFRVSATSPGIIRGQFSYMSPEAIMGMPLLPASIVFTFGIVLYQLIGGRRPFDRDTDLGTLQAIRISEHQPLAQVVSVPEQISSIVDHALRAAPEERFLHCGELADRLDAAIPPEVGPSAVRDQVARFHPELLDAHFDAADTQPGTPAEDPELELLRQIRADPDAVDPYLVYADLLQSRGDPRGELIMLQHRGLVEAQEDLHFRHPKLLGELSSMLGRLLTAEWHLGFIRSLQVRMTAVHRPSIWLFELLERQESARFLRHLAIGPRDGSNDLDDVYELLGRSRLRLSSLFVGDLSEGPPMSWHRNVDALCTAFPKLERLTLRGANIQIGRLVLPELRELAIQTTAVSPELRIAIEHSTLPKLEKLDLSPP